MNLSVSFVITDLFNEQNYNKIIDILLQLQLNGALCCTLLHNVALY